jgi:hypothetical protein
VGVYPLGTAGAVGGGFDPPVKGEGGVRRRRERNISGEEGKGGRKERGRTS